jgi:PhnB protein
MNATPTQYPALSPSIAVNDARRAIDFYKAAFGAVELFRLVDPESAKIGHAELAIGGSVLMLADEYPAFNKSPQTLGGTAVRLCIMVDDVDATVRKAAAAGATVLRQPNNEFYGHRCANLRDPFGHEWMVSHEIEKVTPAEMQRRWDAMAKK